MGAALPNVVPPLSRRVEKFHEVTPTSPKIVGAKTLNFKPNFKCSPLIFFGGPPSSIGSCDSKTWYICSARVKHLRGSIS